MATYYIKNGGNDSLNGLSDGNAWATVSKVNTEWSNGTFTPGDYILFSCGDTFYGTITVSGSGTVNNPITIGSYGTGNKPIIEGFTTLTSWTQVGSTSVYYSSATFESAPGILLLNGNVREKGKYPNSGYNVIDNVVTTGSISVGDPVEFQDYELPSSPDLDGAEIVIKFDRWTVSRSVITNHTGTSVTFNTPYDVLPKVGWGYFIQNHSSTLNDFGDWYYDSSTSRIYMNFNGSTPASHTIRVSTLTNIIYANAYQRSYITIDNLRLQGSCLNNIHMYNNVSYITVSNCEILYSGGDAIYTHGGLGNVIEDNIISYSNYNAITILYSSYAYVGYNTISHTGHYLGNCATTPGGSWTAIQATGTTGNNVIEYNHITYTGYLPINWGGTNTIVNNNYIDTYCYNKDDGAGIYVFNDRTTGKQVNNNIVLNAIGAPEGTNVPGSNSAHGLYTDGGSSDVSFVGNIVGNVNQGYHGNLPVNITMTNNTFFQCQKFMGMWKFGYTFWWDGTYVFINGLDITGNKFISSRIDESMPEVITYQNSTAQIYTDNDTEIQHFGTIDNNYYYVNTECAVHLLVSGGTESAPKSIARWAIDYGHDVNSTFELLDTYTLNSIGSNLLTNGTFNSNTNGWTTTTGASATWDSDELGDGGCIALTSTINNYEFYWWTNSNTVTTAISGGAISNANHYLLRFLGKSTIDEKTMALKLYSTGTTTPLQRFFTIGNTNTQKDVLFSHPATVSSGATMRLSLTDDPITTYMDNIGLYVADVTLTNMNNYLHLLYNETSETQYYDLSATMEDVTGAQYSGTIALDSWEGLVLMGSGTVTETVLSSPTVTTTAITSITTTTASSGGNVTDDGGATVTARGVCWNTTGTPTTANNTTSNGTGTGSYTSSLTGLTSDTIYYVRAYATNSEGTSYGNQLSFETSEDTSPPTVLTESIKDIQSTAAVTGGSILSDGNTPVLSKGVCWNTTGNPTIADNYTNDGTGTASYVSYLTNLNSSTHYYVRAYATNIEGVGYGTILEFDTLEVKSPLSLIDGLLGYWNLNETFGDALDSVGLLNGIVSVTTRGTSGKLSTAYTFNESNNDYINFGSVCKPTTGLTISMWIKPEIQLNTWAGIIINQYWYGSNDLDGYLVQIYDNKILFELSNRTNYSSLLSNTSLSIGEWHHIVCTWDGTTMKIYINSVAPDNTLARTHSIGYNIPFNLYFGYNSQYYDYSGMLDEVGIWNRALDVDEITFLYNSGDGLEYPFDGSSSLYYLICNYQIL